MGTDRAAPRPSGVLVIISHCAALRPYVLRSLDTVRNAGFDVRADAVAPRPAGALVALDLTRCSNHEFPGDLDAFRAVELFVLAREDQTMPVSWAVTLRSRRVSVIVEKPEGPTAYQRLAALLLARVARRRHGVERAVVRALRDAGLAEFTDLARLVLRDPWGIRRPRDLAHACQTSPKRLRQWRDDSPFARVEHFIALVRWIAFDYLVKAARLSAGDALAIVGGTEVSNLKRQVEPVAGWWARRRADGKV